MKVLDFNKPEKKESIADWKKRSADGAPPGVYTPNMSHTDMLKWKAKHINAGKADAHVEIAKTFKGTQCKIVVTKQEPIIQISANGKMQMTKKDFMDLNTAVNEAISLLFLNQ